MRRDRKLEAEFMTNKGRLFKETWENKGAETSGADTAVLSKLHTTQPKVIMCPCKSWLEVVSGTCKIFKEDLT